MDAPLAAASSLPQTLKWMSEPPEFGHTFALLHLLLLVAVLVTGTSRRPTRELLPQRALGAILGAGFGLLLTFVEAELADPGVMFIFFTSVAGLTAMLAFGVAGARAAVERPGGRMHVVLGAWVIAQPVAFAAGSGLGINSFPLFFVAGFLVLVLGAALWWWETREVRAEERAASTPRPRPRAPRGGRPWLAWAIVALGLVGGLAFAGWWWTRDGYWVPDRESRGGEHRKYLGGVPAG